jgi:PAS domain S-box-containing protein
MNGKILVVDDEKSIRYTFNTFLSDEGYEVSTAEDFDTGLALLSTSDFDLIYADIILGGKSGIDFLREVKKRRINCPIIMITGNPNIETASEAVRHGAFDYLTKPIYKEDILRVAGMALQFKAVADERERYRSNLEAVFRSVRDAIITIDKDLRITQMNDAAMSACGFSQESIGKSFHSLQHPCTGQCVKALTETIREHKPVELNRIECRNDNSRHQIMTINTSPLSDNLGNFTGAVLVVRDETRIAALERDLEERHHFHNLVGKNREMQRIYEMIDNLANVQTTVLITGESGTGKELVAEAIHHRGERSTSPLVKVNCSALSENLLESELFGHVKGAFTGAIQDKIGRFQLAHGGSIFLDEIGDLSPRMQLRLLRVLQEKEFERVGESRTMKTDVRVIAATNQPLLEKVKRGDYREDLYYRLKVVELNLPPLRDRKEDIPLLVTYFIKRFNDSLKKKLVSVSDDVLKLFMGYHWPGNVRELEHAIEHAFIVCQHSTITVDDLPAEIRNSFDAEASSESERGTDSKEKFLAALEKTDWNKAKAARLLGMSRRTLYRKLEEYQISRNSVQ